MVDNASEKVHFIIGINDCPDAYKMKAYIETRYSEVDENKSILNRFDVYKFENNSVLSAFNFMIDRHSNVRTNKEPFFIVTELDVVVPNGFDWIKEVRELQQRSAYTGFPLSLDNYLSPNSGHCDDEGMFGLWLTGLNRDKFFTVYDKSLAKTKKPLSDNWLRTAMTRYGPPARSKTRLKHLSWNLPFEEDEFSKDYWQRKVNRVQWDKAPECNLEIWSRNYVSNYEI